MDRSTERVIRLVFGGVVAAFGTLMAVPATATAAPLWCMPQPGSDVTVIDGKAACGTKSDPSSHAASVGSGGVGYAEAGHSAAAVGVGYDGGVGASEAHRSAVAAIAVGRGSVALASVEQSTIALVLSGPGGQAFVGDAAKGVQCGGGLSLAVNVTAGQGCASDGRSVWIQG